MIFGQDNLQLTSSSISSELLHWLPWFRKETCLQSSLHVYSEQGYIPQECNGSKAASQFPATTLEKQRKCLRKLIFKNPLKVPLMLTPFSWQIFEVE